MRWAAFVCVLVGCIHDDLVHCADGNACPVGLVCDPAHHACATQEQIDACRDLPDLEACLTDATCHEGVCLPNGCGNGRTDPPEACDDGNTASGDGCASDCSSDETCGNGITDLIELETCDDGNRRSHDGCDSLCIVEQPRWRQILPILPPTLRSHAGAYDPVRRVVVVFGGEIASGESARTLEYSIDTSSWTDVTPAISPPARQQPAMTYDAERGVVVMFGGYASLTTFGDTWLWNGRTWTEVDTPTMLSVRGAASMAYDTRRKKVVLFGGEPSTSTTWEWDGEWHAIDVAGAPPSRRGAPMAYDPVHGEIVMYGGIAATSYLTDGTWLWNGTTWRNVADNAPGNRGNVSMVYDPTHGGVLVTGGPGGGTTYVWNGQAWQQLGDASSFMAELTGFVLFYDPIREVSMTYGGMALTGPTGAMYRWFAGNNAWVGYSPATPPQASTFVGMAYDAWHKTVTRFGGIANSSPAYQTFDLVGDAWVERIVTNAPGGRGSPQLVYNSAHRTMVMFGGAVISGLVYELHETTWSVIGTGTPERNATRAIYDPDADVILSFGGVDYNGITTSDAFVFDGTWQQVPGPTATRNHHVLVYDEAAKHVVMASGAGGSGPQEQDTWTWTLANGWTQLLPAATPTTRMDASATYDPLRKEVVMFGGLSGSTQLADTWRWNGTKWSRIDVDVLPPPNDSSALAYDRVHERFIMYGPETWVLQWTSRISDEVCQVGFDRDGDGLQRCDDPDCAAICESCGNAACDPAETCRNCPEDCGACASLCGDTYCDGDEAQSCPGDCP